jgi:sporulation protein YlmC with PRC-barrel domain
MTRLLTSTMALALAAGVAGATGARAQTEATGQAAEAGARGCSADLQTLVQRMDEDGFWLSGYGTEGYGMTGPVGTAPTGTAGVPADQAAPVEEQVTGGTASAVAPGVGLDSPRFQARALYEAALVLAHRGNEESCNQVVGELARAYGEYVERLEAAGIDASEVIGWRQEQLALAQPIAEAQAMSAFRLDNLTGTDVRNMQDEHLGSVSDVMIEPSSGDVQYVLLSRGGFLGMGAEHIAVPWDRLMATPGLNSLVLDATTADIESAPSVDAEALSDPEAGAPDREATDRFWSERN